MTVSVIISKDNCPKCEELKKLFPDDVVLKVGEDISLDTVRKLFPTARSVPIHFSISRKE